METKQCAHCKEVKPISDFHKDSQCVGGHKCWCKTCKNNYQKKYFTTPAGKASNKKAKIKYYKKPECRVARKAQRILNKAVDDGRVFRQPCNVCGVLFGNDGHHPDYSKPLDVIWLCRKHHAALHKAEREARHALV